MTDIKRSLSRLTPLVWLVLAACGGSKPVVLSTPPPPLPTMEAPPPAPEPIADGPLGVTVEDTRTVFRLDASAASEVRLVTFTGIEDSVGVETVMGRTPSGAWAAALDGQRYGTLYGFRLTPTGPLPQVGFTPETVIADPYGNAMAQQVAIYNPARSLVVRSEYNWEGDTGLAPADPRDWVIYEMNVRDMTAHPTSEAGQPGTYRGLIEPGKSGGIDYIKKLGVNAVELLPTQEFGNVEIPFGVETYGLTNTWNPYARNHWGYMTSGFFAPESYYATGGTMRPGAWNGADGRQVTEFKDMVKAFHRSGISVLMDVVYNHVSQYEFNPFKTTGKATFFQLNADGSYKGDSGTGNDFRTESPEARAMIVASLKHWVSEYHIDGFRFDLGAMIDWQTIDEITTELRKINPNIVLIAEPWGGGKYAPAEFSEHGWASWNDRIRNGVKGQNPETGQGFIFGKFSGDNTMAALHNEIIGTLRSRGGLFSTPRHAVNYLESHDDETLGDFIRVALGEHMTTVVADRDGHAKLTPRQLALNRLAALFLLTSQGMTMIHEGQEFARSKVIAPTDAPDPRVGQLDRNSYDKDNATNYLNFDHARANAGLVDYYRGLIALRMAHPALRRSDTTAVTFLAAPAPTALGYTLDGSATGDTGRLVVLMNGDPANPVMFTLPAGRWTYLVDERRAGTDPVPLTPTVSGRIRIPPTSGAVLRRDF